MKWLINIMKRSKESEEQRQYRLLERQQFYEERERLNRIAAEQEGEVLRLKQELIQRRKS